MKQAACFLVASLIFGCAHQALILPMKIPERTPDVGADLAKERSEAAASVPMQARADLDDLPTDAKSKIVRQVEPFKKGPAKENPHPSKPIESPITATSQDHEWAPTSLPRRSATPGCAFRPTPSEMWYGAGAIAGAIFSSILAPLLVEFIKHRFHVGLQRP
jgi:hypothetical protein